jgi:4-amino-4-deoxy-L-arabinose transferase-like glycosyltransferase
MKEDSNSTIYIVLFLIIAAVSCFIVISTFKGMQFAPQADEGYYFKYASHILHNGLGGFPLLFKDYTEDQQNWLFPNPLRIGYIALAAVWFYIFGTSFASLAYLSLFCFAGFLLISFYFIKKYFDGKTALLCGTLLAFSPLGMAMARRALTESAVNFLMTLSVWLFWGMIREAKTRKTVLFVLVYAFTVLVKETGALLSVFFVVYMLLRRYVFKAPVRLSVILSATLFPALIVAAAYALASSDMSRVAAIIRIVLFSPKTNQYAILLGSGLWFRYLIDFMMLSPWVCILAIGFFVRYLAGSEYKEPCLYFIAYAAAFVFFANFFTKNIRYINFIDMPMRLFAVLMLSDIIKRHFKKHGFAVLAILVILISLQDYANFYDLFLRKGIYDPVTFNILQGRLITPVR